MAMIPLSKLHHTVCAEDHFIIVLLSCNHTSIGSLFVKLLSVLNSSLSWKFFFLIRWCIHSAPSIIKHGEFVYYFILYFFNFHRFICKMNFIYNFVIFWWKTMVKTRCFVSFVLKGDFKISNCTVMKTFSVGAFQFSASCVPFLKQSTNSSVFHYFL
jgi:hypothetical protein